MRHNTDFPKKEKDYIKTHIGDEDNIEPDSEVDNTYEIKSPGY